MELSDHALTHSVLSHVFREEQTSRAYEVTLAVVRKFAPAEEPAVALIFEQPETESGTLIDAPGQFGLDPVTAPIFAAVVAPIVIEFSKEFTKRLADEGADAAFDWLRTRLRLNRRIDSGELSDETIDKVAKDIDNGFRSGS